MTTVNHFDSGPAGSADHLHEAALDLYAVQHFLEAPLRLSPKDWQQAYDGLGHVIVAVERLAATLAARCPDAGHTAELASVQELLRTANTVLSRTDTLPG